MAEILDQMRTLVVRSGIPESQYDSVLERAGNAKEMSDLQDLHDRLQDILTVEWKAAWDIWKLPSISNPEAADEVWDRYDMLELTGNPEQLMLAEKLPP